MEICHCTKEKMGCKLVQIDFFFFCEYNNFLIEINFAFEKYSSKIIFALVSEWRMRAMLPVVGTVYSHVSTTLLICYPEKYMPNTPIQALKQPWSHL